MEKRTPEQLEEASIAFEEWRIKVRDESTPFYSYEPGEYCCDKAHEQARLPEMQAWREFRNSTPIHSAVIQAMRSHIPSDPIRLLQEYPATSTTDLTRLAYTREQSHWAATPVRRTVTSIGKYLTRHFPTLPPHEVRDITALFVAGEQFKIVWTMPEMLSYLKRGPKSCMTTNDFSHLPAHPYATYDPEYGWGMAVRMEGEEVMGRALVNKEDGLCFVRTYKNTGGYSHPDEMLCAWLKTQGYAHRCQWPDGLKLKLIPYRSTFVSPYIDGGQQRVAWCSFPEPHLKIDEDGSYQCDSQEGTASEQDEDSYFTCENCDDRFHTDEAYSVYRPYGSTNYDSICVCEGCRTSDFVELENNYEVHTDNAVCLHDGTYIDDRFSYIELRNGEYAKPEDVIQLLDDTYVLAESDEVICLANGQYVTPDWAGLWRCAEAEEYYLEEDDKPVWLDGETYHEDSATVVKMREAQAELELADEKI